MAIFDKNYGKEESKGLQYKDILEMEKILQNSSYAHEYARVELANSDSAFKTEQLLEKLESYKRVYFYTRRYMAQHYPERLAKLEQDLLDQKRDIFVYHSD